MSLTHQTRDFTERINAWLDSLSAEEFKRLEAILTEEACKRRK